MLQTEPATVDDFSGGITDFYVNASPNRYENADNLLILKTGEGIGKLVSRPGSELYDDANPQIPAGSQRIGTIIDFNDTIFVQSARKLYYISSGFQTLQGPSANDLFPTGTDTTNIVSYAEWNDHLFITNDAFTNPQKVYADGSSTLRLRTAGMPALASAPTVTAGGAGAQNYVYAFLYHYDYAVGTRNFEDFGAVTNVSLVNSLAPDASAVAITNIPAIANGTTHNYDTASSNLKVYIYRTITNGTTFYFVGSVNNGTTTFNDNVSDATIQNNALLYTEGGVVENDTPPMAKLIHIVEDTAYYAHIKSGTEIQKSRIRQSIVSDPDSCPASFFVDVEDEIVGLSSAKGTVVALCKNSVFRVDGKFDELGIGGMFAQRISDTSSCVSSQSVVQTLDGVFWAGEDGIYYTDGFNVLRINDQWRNRYLSLVDSSTARSRIQGKYDRKNRRIWWVVQQDSAQDCDVCYVLDLNWPISSESAFTTISGGENFAPSAIEFVSDTILRGDRRGYLFIHRDTIFNDPVVDAGVTPADWLITPIIYNYESAASNFGTDFLRKFIPRMNLTLKNETNVSVQIISNNDDGKKVADLRAIRFRGNLTWGDDDVYWDDDDILWNQEGLIENQRRFPANNLRCSYKQIRITNGLVAIVSSDLLGNCTVDSLAKTATLVDAAGTDWPTHAVSYYIAFGDDDYTREYLITERTSDDVLTYSDAANLSPTGNQEWVLRGIPKNEIIHILSYTIHYALLGKTQQAFRSGETGEVGS